jgi:Uncharacterized protein conserved in bacteria
MDKFYSCAVVSQRPTQFKFKYQEYMTSCKRLKKRLHDVFMELYRRGVRRYYVGGALGVDLWAGEILLEMRWQEECPELKIVLVYPFPGHDERWDPKSRERLHRLKENCDQFVMGRRGVGAQGYKERTVYMVQCADCLVAVYNNDPQRAGSIRVAMRIAKTRRLPLVLIHPNTGKISRIG